MNLIGSFLLQELTKTPPVLLNSFSNASDSLSQRPASVELMPVSEMVVPSTIGPSHEFSFAAAGEVAPAASNDPIAMPPNSRFIWHPPLEVVSAMNGLDTRWRKQED